ncbi:MAG: helix-turn-helix transcriptional regulator [Spirosomataceae bacterium]
METFGERLKHLTKFLGINTSTLANKVGYAQGSISRLINNETKPNSDFFIQLAKCYPNVSRDWLLLGIGEMLIKEDKGEAYQEELRELRQMKNFLMAEIEMYREREKKFLQLGKFNGVHPIAVLEVAA